MEIFCWHFSVVEPEGVSVFSGAGSSDAGEVRPAAVSEESISLLRRLFSIVTVCVASFPRCVPFQLLNE